MQTESVPEDGNMSASKKSTIDGAIIVDSKDGKALFTNTIVNSSATSRSIISDFNASNKDPVFDLHQQALHSQKAMFPSHSSSTPVSFIQMMPTTLSSGSVSDIARTGGRRSRGIRHRGGTMVGGSMSVFSIKSDEPKTPTQRARGSIRGKLSRTSSGSSKRKRSNENKDSDSESSENYTPLSQSRSGRKIIQATPVIKIEEQLKGSPKSGDKTNSATKANNKTPEKKRSGSKKTPGGAAAVCKNCGRLHSPGSNPMVFCDGCNTGWHQHCHDPPIPQDIITIESKEWFCTDCTVLREEKTRLQGKISGQNMSLLEVSTSTCWLFVNIVIETEASSNALLERIGFITAPRLLCSPRSLHIQHT